SSRRRHTRWPRDWSSDVCSSDLASSMVLLVELARSGALEQYKDLLAPLIGWGPGLLIVLGFLWLANSYAPPFLETQRLTATALRSEERRGGKEWRFPLSPE